MTGRIVSIRLFSPGIPLMPAVSSGMSGRSALPPGSRRMRADALGRWSVESCAKTFSGIGSSISTSNSAGALAAAS
jgi:hypothetical protein